MNGKRVTLNILAPLAGLAVFVAIWYAASAAIGIEIVLPSPTDTFRGFFSLLGQGSFYLAIGHTLGRSLLAFLVAFSLAVLFAILGRLSLFFRKAFRPIAVILRVLPTISVILLVLIWFRSAVAPYVITFLVLFPMLYTTVSDATDTVDKGLLEMTKAYRFSRTKTIFSFYVPQMIPSILTGVAITLSFAVKLTIAAEVLAYTGESMGRFMQQSSAYMETSMLLAWTLAAILLGFLLEGLVLCVRRIVMRRYYGVR
ncbi:MAG: ABC transporter permease subunit [Clostridia bacterium]|nr:ABC transporter permease subunit [Clostridia bacterium]